MKNTFHFDINDSLIRPEAETPKTICTMDVCFEADPSEYLKLLEVIAKALDVKRDIVLAVWPEIFKVIQQGMALAQQYQELKLAGRAASAY